jgi:2-polyprenyl-6-methoxyphenol hydroxylase-like FAD-dependent oxidoreductase
MTLDIDTSVLIVGAGPVGLALAVDLGWRGIDCVVIDQHDGQFLLPRASGVTARTMEFCRRWGIVEQIRAAGFPNDYKLDMVFCTSLDGYLLERDAYPALQDLPPQDFTPENKYRCPQHMFDPVLERAAAAYPSVRIRRCTRLDGFVDDGESILASVTQLVDAKVYDFDTDAKTAAAQAEKLPGERYRIRAKYLVGCDGVNSGVRDMLGITTEGNPALSYSISGLLEAPGLERFHTKGTAERYIFVGNEGVWGNLTVVDGRGEWRLTISGAEEKLDLKRFDMAAAVRRCLGRDDIPFKLTTVTPWRRRQMVATRLRKGRAFLAGDSVHAMSPTGGFGMSTGAADSVDLGWKLEATLRGWGGANLLDSYEAERHPVAVRNTAAAADNFKPWRLQLDYSRIHEASAEGDADRRVIGQALKEAFKPEWETWGTTMGYRYEDSPICVADGTPAYPDHSMLYEQTSRPGSRAPHAWLPDGRSTIDLYGRGFVLMRFGSEGTSDDASLTTSITALLSAAQAVGMPLEVVPIDEPAIAALYERKLVLVRPDGHVSWRGDRLPADVKALVDTVRGESPSAAGRRAPDVAKSHAESVPPLVYPEEIGQG